MEDNGLLLWQGNKKAGKHWVALAGTITVCTDRRLKLRLIWKYSSIIIFVFFFLLVKDGYLEYHMYLGSGLKHLRRSRDRVDDGQRHTAVFTKIMEKAELQVDQGPKDDSVLGSNTGNVGVVYENMK